MRCRAAAAAIAEGGIIVSKVIKENRALSQQLMLYRDFIRAVFLRT
jgi:TetR/AcrR family transcriptional regulator, transcriptional repressor for nem operon